MKFGISTLCVLAMVLLWPIPISAQSSTGQQRQPPAPKQTTEQPASAKAPGPPTDKNPFPEDTDSVPVMTNEGAAPPPAADDVTAGNLLSHEDTDPARSPDQVGSDGGATYSSSSAGMDELLPDPDTGKLKKGEKPIETVPHASAKEDESVANYYLSQHNWQAALSRYESALVLDPENPDVYWGMAEAQRNLKQFAAARQNYLKVMAYDPDSKHAKEARKILDQPEFQSVSAESNSPKQK